MFVRYFVEIPSPMTKVEEELLRNPKEWVPALARDAEGRGRRLLADVGFGRGSYRVSKRVEIEFAEPIRFPSRIALPMSWRATGPEALFPSLDADIEVAPFGPDRTQLSISARYKPPMGPVGRAIDRGLLHVIAEATMKDFLDRLAVVLDPTLTPA